MIVLNFYKRVKCKKLTALSFAFLICFSTAGQQLRGYVFSKNDHEKIEGVNLIIQSIPDSLIVSYASTNENGLFDLKFNPVVGKSYFLKASHLMYKPVVIALENNIDFTLPLYIEIETSEHVLNSVLVTAVVSVVQREDSITYDVDSFRNTSDRTLEDVLKKMPGIRVESNGDILYKNKAIKKILLDGDDIIGEKYKLATRSIDPSLLDKVQAIEHYNENGLLRTIEQSDDTILNLTIKEERKNVLFGKADIKYGITNKYDGLSNLFSYNRKFRAYSITSINNMGFQRLDIASPINSKIQKKQLSIDNDMTPLSNLNEPFLRPLTSQLENINNEKIQSLNFSLKPKKSYKITVGLLTSIDSRLQNRTQDYQALNESNLTYSQDDTLRHSPRLTQFLVNGNFDLSKSENITVKSSIISSKIGLSQRTSLRSSAYNFWTPEQFSNSLFQSQQSFEYSIKIANSHAIVTSISLFNGNLNEQLSTKLTSPLYSTIFSDSLSYQNNLVRQDVIQRISTIIGEIGFLSGNSKSKLGIYMGYITNNHMISLDQKDNGMLNEHKLNVDRCLPYFRINIQKKWNFFELSQMTQFNLLSSQLDNQNTNTLTYETTLNAAIKLNKKNQLNLSFSKNISPISNTYYLNNYVIRDYRSVQQGGMSFLFDKKQQVSLYYSFIDPQKRNLTMAIGFYATYNNNYWSFSHYTQTANYSLTTLFNAKQMMQSGFEISLNKLVYPLSGNVKFNYKLTRDVSPQIVNGEFQNLLANQHNISANYVSVFSIPFNFDAGISCQHSYSEVSETNTSVERYNIITKPHIKLIIKGKLYQITSTVENYRIIDKSTTFIKAEGIYRINEKFNITLQAFNLANQKQFDQVTLTPILYAFSSIGLMQRTIILGVSFTF